MPIPSEMLTSVRQANCGQGNEVRGNQAIADSFAPNSLAQKNGAGYSSGFARHPNVPRPFSQQTFHKLGRSLQTDPIPPSAGDGGETRECVVADLQEQTSKMVMSGSPHVLRVT